MSTVVLSGNSIDNQQFSAPECVPPLRQDLEILEGWPEHTGAPTWLLYDPFRNRYFRIKRSVFLILSGWNKRTIAGVRQAARSSLNRDVSLDEIGDIIKFLFANQLVSASPQADYRHFFEFDQQGARGFWTTLLHSYLFFKVPLVRPQKFLEASWVIVAPLFTSVALWIFALMGVLGLYLVSQQWEDFKGQFEAFISFEGFLFYAISLVFVKICHELGHAFMAYRYGLKVPVIGIAFMVLMPILYTDTSDAWRLKSRRQRLMIDCAGIFAELCLAAIATLFWVFLPDGFARSVAFSIAAVSWVLSIAINLNPFMRFDGYYVLSDLLGVENLQSRGFDFAKWRLRELLFKLKLPPPEIMRKSLRRTLILHAWGTWIYRFFLFLGIALLVYSFFVKVVGVFLFIVEILWFILLPILREIRNWFKMRNLIMKSGRTIASAVVFVGLVGLVVLPLSASVSVPAILHAQDEINIYPPISAQLVEINVDHGRPIEMGAIMARFQSDELEMKTALLRNKMALNKRLLERGAADQQDGANRRILLSEREGFEEELESLQRLKEELTLRAPMTARVVDINPEIHIGRPLEKSQLMFRLVREGELALSGVLGENEIARISVGSAGVFVPDSGEHTSLKVSLKHINKTALSTLPHPDLSEQFGGMVPTKSAHDGTATVRGSYYGLKMQVDGSGLPAIDQTLRGVVHLDAHRRSLAQTVIARIGAVLMRESGF